MAHCSLSQLKSLLGEDTDFEIQDKNGQTPFHMAIKRNFLNGIDLFLEKGVIVNVKDNEGNTPLHSAVLTRNANLVKILINKGAVVKEKDKFGLTCFHMAAYNNDWNVFDVLLQSINPSISQYDVEVESLKIILSKEYETSEENDINTLIHMRNDKGETPLHIAVRKAKPNLVAMLLHFGAETDSRNNIRQTPLVIAVINESEQTAEESGQIVKLLVATGADVNITYEGQEHLLFSAIRKRNIKIITELLNNGANVEVRQTDTNMTPLIFSAIENLEPEFEHLLESGCEINVRDDNFTTPLDYVIRNKNFNLVEKLLVKGLQGYSQADIASAISDMFNVDLVQTVDLILNNKFDINMRLEYGKTPLHYVSNNGQLVEILMNNGADIELTDIFGMTPLLTAMKNHMLTKEDEDKDVTGIEALIKRGASVIIKDDEGKNLLHYAVTSRDFVDIVLSKGGDIEEKDNYGRSPIFSAVDRDDVSALELVLKLGANVDVQDSYGKTPLHYSARSGNPALVNILLSSGANTELKDNEGQTPLFETILIEELEDNYNTVITILIEKGAFVNATNNLGRTVLFYVMNSEVLKKMLNSGGDVSIKDNNGQTALHLAMSLYDNYDNNLHDVDLVIEQLIEKGGNLLSEDNEGITPLQMFLCRKKLVPGHMSDIKPLLVAADDVGHTLLHVAAENNWYNCVKHLLDIGVVIDSKNKYGVTALHLAAQNNDENGVKIARELLKRGAATSEQDHNKDTPLHKAVCYGNEDLIKDLLVRGARMDIENSCEVTPLQAYFENEPQVNKMIEHIVKLKTANLLDDITCNVDSVDCTAYNSLRDSCFEELKRLEECKFDCLSLIDVFRKRTNPMFVSSNTFREIITSPLLELQFPIYDLYLKVNFEKAELRNSLLNNANVVLAKALSHLRLPNEVLRQILYNLPNEDLSILVEL